MCDEVINKNPKFIRLRLYDRSNALIHIRADRINGIIESTPRHPTKVFCSGDSIPYEVVESDLTVLDKIQKSGIEERAQIIELETKINHLEADLEKTEDLLHRSNVMIRQLRMEVMNEKDTKIFTGEPADDGVDSSLDLVDRDNDPSSGKSS